MASDADAQRLVQRSIMARGIYEIWGRGRTFEELMESLHQCPPEKMAPYMGEDKSFSIQVESFNKAITPEEKVKLMNQIRFIPWKGPVKCKNPDVTYGLFLTYVRGPDPLKQPYLLYFGRYVGGSMREQINRYTLKKRTYIGPTSTDAELAFLMANQGHVKRTSMVLDPFVGTGSLLVSSAHFGALCYGTDIDYSTIKGKGEQKHIFANFQQYGLPRPEIFRADCSRMPWRVQPPILFDAIICDPPYGFRAGAKKIAHSDRPLFSDPKKIQPYIPHLSDYHVNDVLIDLFIFAARHLVLGGRLVFLYPTLPEYRDDDLPGHGCLELVANSEQLCSTFCRRLITMQKVREFDPSIEVKLPEHLPGHSIVYDNWRQQVSGEGPKAKKAKNKHNQNNVDANGVGSNNNIDSNSMDGAAE
eukprot:TRINITY_DN4316_c0_g2_i1.p1 TRINITY_DN4316_c0_g2~~TRINITY_DN4316_c0_g2_i1.p1  ORF type:complete len:484 (-),score=76.41 TRINITY_DN4316_c0_g2_i1:28-1275(-)